MGWSWMSDLNRRPHDYESGALPTELIQRDEMSAYALYHAISVCQCRRRGFLPVKIITICNQFARTGTETENPGNSGRNEGSTAARGVEEKTVFLLNPAVILTVSPEICLGLAGENGLRNPLTEGAIQQVIHIVHIVVHIQIARQNRPCPEKPGKIQQKNRGNPRFLRKR